MIAWAGMTGLAGGPSRRLIPVEWRQDALAVAAMAVVYFVLFLVIRDDSLSGLLEATARNVASLAVSGAVARPWIRRALRLTPWPQAAAHLTLALGFSVLWLWLLTLAGSVLGAGSLTRFAVNPFLVGPAAEWQLFQGIFVYGGLACLIALAERGGRTGGLIVLTEAQLAERSLLMRDGEEIRPLAMGRIVAIKGADDYAELVTTDGARLVQTRLAAFEAMLDPSRFVRVHRSAIVNLDHLERAEPAGGGRLLLHMSAGETICSSREGAKALRDRLI